MNKNKLFDFHFPDGFPENIASGELASDADALHMAAFEFFDRLDEALQYETFPLPASLSETDRETAQAMQDIKNEHIRAVYKLNLMQAVQQQVKDCLALDRADSKTDQPVHLAMAHTSALSKLRVDAVMRYNSIIKSLEFMVFQSYNFKDHACRVFDDLEKADAVWRRQARHELHTILAMTDPSTDRKPATGSAAQG